MSEPPVALFIFNRPDLTARVFRAIAEARPRRLFVVADGPREDHPDDRELVRRTREVARAVDWPCEVRTNYSEINLGCGERIATGLQWVFEHAPEAILLEDDCLPHPTFFRFCSELLDRYRDDERVHMISGSNVVGESGAYSYHFSRCYHIWGWATWARAWQHYDFQMSRWPELRDTEWLGKHVADPTAARLTRLFFDETYAGRIRQWDFQWTFCGWLRDAVVVMPRVNLVTNIGYGPGGTHKRDHRHPFARLPSAPMTFPLRHPSEVEVLEEFDRAVWEALIPRFLGPVRRRPWGQMAERGRRALGRLAGGRAGSPGAR